MTHVMCRRRKREGGGGRKRKEGGGCEGKTDRNEPEMHRSVQACSKVDECRQGHIRRERERHTHKQVMEEAARCMVCAAIKNEQTHTQKWGREHREAEPGGRGGGRKRMSRGHRNAAKRKTGERRKRK